MNSLTTASRRKTISSIKTLLFTASLIRPLHSQSFSISSPYQIHRHTQSTEYCPARSHVLGIPLLPNQCIPSARVMSTSTQQDPAIQEILDYWFSYEMDDWFKDSSKLDPVITSRFGSLVEKARLTDSLDESWSSTPSGSLALILLLDQFTRNIFRPGNHPNPGLSWSGDAKALKIACRAVSQGYDRQIQNEHASHQYLGYGHRCFFYLPFMHAEDLTSQNACVAFYEIMRQELQINKLTKEANGEGETDQEKNMREMMDLQVSFAARHRDCIATVGRFPSRNEYLDREHSEAERKWLEDHPIGF